jgi:Golgi phosphoprotein 3 (GPP34)
MTDQQPPRLGEDLLLLGLDAGRGRLQRVFVISYGLMGAELVQLAVSGRIDIVDDQIVVKSLAPTGDAELDAALAGIGEPDSPSRPGEWVARPPPHITGRYLERLSGAGVICKETGFRTAWRDLWGDLWMGLASGLGTTRWRICDAAPCRSPRAAGPHRLLARRGRSEPDRLRGPGLRVRPGPVALPGQGPARRA